jgi:hypothetical protein
MRYTSASFNGDFHVELKLVRGFAADLAPADEKGCVDGRIGEQKVRLHRDLSTAVKAGEEVLVGGELRNEILHALALKNFTRRKLFRIDPTFYVLGTGLGGYLALMGLIFAGQTSTIAGSREQLVNAALIGTGFVILWFVLRRALRIVKVTRWIDAVRE